MEVVDLVSVKGDGGKRAKSYELRLRASDSQGIPDHRTCEWHGEAENGDGAERTRCARDLKE